MNNSGLFITFEGGEGAGKSSLIQEIATYLTSLGHEPLISREPGGCVLAEKIRTLLLDIRSIKLSICDKAELLLFLAARAQHIEEVIQPALTQGKIVLCDRFNDSTIAYQGEGRGLGFDRVQAWCEEVCTSVLPDKTFFLDVDPQEGLNRSRKVDKNEAAAQSLDRIERESISFHQKVQRGFLKLIHHNPDRFIHLNANQAQAKVIQEALNQFEAFMKIRDIDGRNSN